MDARDISMTRTKLVLCSSAFQPGEEEVGARQCVRERKWLVLTEGLYVLAPVLITVHV